MGAFIERPLQPGVYPLGYVKCNMPTNFAEHVANGEQRVYIACLPGGHPHPALSARRIMVIRRVSMAQPALRVVEGASMDKSKALDAALSQIERAFGKGSIMRLGKNSKAMDIDTIPTGSLSL